MGWSRLFGRAGRVLLAAGVLVLLFVAFQLWGTGLHEAQAQKDLTRQFSDMLATARASTSSAPATSPDSHAPPPASTSPVAPSVDLAPSIGDPIGEIRIPRIHLDKIIVQGVSLTQLDRAPGHYPQTPFPGQAGNAGIAGHRTTYGAPFGQINKLEPGDEITITTLQGTFTYVVQWAKIVLPKDVWVLDTAPDHPNTLTLTACHPRQDLSHRYIVRAVLQGKPVPEFSGQAKTMEHYRATAGKLAGGVSAPAHPEAWLPTVLWGVLCALIWLAAWWSSKTWRRSARTSPPRWVRVVVPYAIGVPLFLGVLFLCFENITLLLPAGL